VNNPSFLEYLLGYSLLAAGFAVLMWLIGLQTKIGDWHRMVVRYPPMHPFMGRWGRAARLYCPTNVRGFGWVHLGADVTGLHIKSYLDSFPARRRDGRIYVPWEDLRAKEVDMVFVTRIELTFAREPGVFFAFRAESVRRLLLEAGVPIQPPFGKGRKPSVIPPPLPHAPVSVEHPDEFPHRNSTAKAENHGDVAERNLL